MGAVEVSRKNIVSHLLFGVLLSFLWVIIGIPIYLNYLAVLNVSMQYLIVFLFGMPVAIVIYSLFFKKNNMAFKTFSISFMIGTVLISILIPIIFDP